MSGSGFEDDLFLLNEQEQEKDRKGSLNILAAELQELQNKDESLACVREALESGSPER